MKPPCPREALALLLSSRTRSRYMESKTAPKDSPFRRNAQPVPTFAITRPATAGPIIWPAKNEVELSATALGRYSSPTSSPTKVCRTGASSAAAAPKTKANTYTCQSRT